MFGMRRCLLLLTVASFSAAAANAQSVYERYPFDTFAGYPGAPSSLDATGHNARFDRPTGVATDSAGNVYVADFGNNTIRKIVPDGTQPLFGPQGQVGRVGTVTTIAGLPSQFGTADGTGSAARFNRPVHLTVDPNGNIFVSDTGSNTIRKITPDGVVSTFAGTPGAKGGTDGVGPAAQFSYPQGIAADRAGNLYVADTGNQTIRKITPAAVVTTFAGTPNVPGNLDGVGTAARFAGPQGVAVDATGNVFVADSGNDEIRKIAPDSTVTTIAGSPLVGSKDGPASAATFHSPIGIAVDASANIFVTDFYGNTIRRISPAGFVTTIGGRPNAAGSQDGAGSLAMFNHPQDIAVDRAGNLYVADNYNDTIRFGAPPAVAQSLNISTRATVQSGDNVLIGGFITSGSTAQKRVILRALGPSLAKAGVQNTLADPVLELHSADGSTIFANDNWRDSQEAEIQATGLAPTDDRESAIVTNLYSPGKYTALVKSADGSSSGVALVEVYDLNQTAGALLANLSTRGSVQTGEAVMIGGFIVGGATAGNDVVVRAIGPSLSSAGVANALADPTLQLYDKNGTVIASNDNWKDSQQAEVQATGLAPSNDLESAIRATLLPGNYTAVVAGKNGSTGVGLVEVYNLN